MKTLDIPYNEVIRVRNSRHIINVWEQLDNTTRAGLILANDPEAQAYATAQKYVREYEKKYY